MNKILLLFDLKDFDALKLNLYKFGGKIIWAIVILLIARLVVWLGSSLIHSVMKRKLKVRGLSFDKLAGFETMFKSILKYFVYIIAILTILTKVFGLIDGASVITTVGIGGLAISLGAQSLIQDIIGGVFIFLEKQLEVGDWIELGNISGTVKELDVRCLELETYEGEIVFVPYGEIRTLVNKSKVLSSVMVDVPFGYDVEVKDAMKLLKDIADNFENPNMTSRLIVLPPTEMDEKIYKVRLFGKCIQCCDWEIERDLRRIVISKAAEEKIKLGFQNNKKTLFEK